MIFTGLFGNETAAKLLIYLQQMEVGYPRQIASTLGLPISQVQRQLERLETEGILASRLLGRTRLYQWNPRCGYLAELRALLSRGITMVPESLLKSLLTERRRPRRPGKPLPKRKRV